MSFIWRIEIKAPKQTHGAFEDLFTTFASAVSSFENEADSSWRIEGFSEAEPDEKRINLGLRNLAEIFEIDIPVPRIDLVPPKDWVAENLTDFPPLRIDRFFIHGSHIEEKPPAGTIPLALDAGTAFGSGEHASTEGCLRALTRLYHTQHFSRILDMGCGSGILSLAAAKLWQSSVIASDIDDEAARVSALNAERNGVGRFIRTTCATGYGARLVRGSAPYDLIICNILARPLMSMAGDLNRHLASGHGYAILSGLLARDGNRVLAAHRSFGLRLVRRITIRGWQTLLVRKL
jgi:ribosomal protein L11 methyltransferase